jgi:hypothetical protein
MSHGEMLLAYDLAFLKENDSHLRGEVETGRNPISKKGNGYFHMHPETEQERCQVERWREKIRID